MLNGKPVIEVTNGLGAKICFLCQSDPRYEVDGQHNLSIILKNHFLSGNLFFSVLDENIFDEEVNSLFDLLLSQFEDIFHLRLQFKADLLELEFLSILADNTEQCIFGIFFVVDLLDVLENGWDEVGCDWLFLIHTCQHFQQFLI